MIPIMWAIYILVSVHDRPTTAMMVMWCPLPSRALVWGNWSGWTNCSNVLKVWTMFWRYSTACQKFVHDVQWILLKCIEMLLEQ
jgi:hypothetical protein